MPRLPFSRRHRDGRIGARVGEPRRAGRAGARPAARAGIAVCCGVAVLLALAWADGGEEPIRPMVEQVGLAEGAR